MDRRITASTAKSRRTPAAVLKLADAAIQLGALPKAFELYEEVLRIAPERSAEAEYARQSIVRSVPDWHARMMNDRTRNRAYDAAIRRAVTPDSLVFEIGTGAGLLAMMAARAGARQVVTCEVNPAVAEVAREIVARNGFADRITVLTKHSGAVTLDDLGGHADVLVSEIVDDGILGEGVLSAHEAAIRDLLKPGGRVIPAWGIVRAALVDTDEAEASYLDHADGFDVRAFRKFINHRNKISSGDPHTRLASDAVDLFRFDLAAPQAIAAAQTTVTLTATGGPATAVARWIALQLDDQARYENRPDADFRSCWEIPLHPLAERVELERGEQFTVHASHDRNRVIVWTDETQ
jgi:predicted RNA methylase